MKKILAIFLCIYSINVLAQQEAIDSLFNQAIEKQRKAIFLSNYIANYSGTINELHVASIGLTIMHENADIQKILHDKLQGNFKNTGQFLNQLEDTIKIWDIDKLVFMDLISDLSSNGSYSPNLTERIQNDLIALKRIQKLYEDEMLETFGRLATRDMNVRRKMWNEFILFLNSEYSINDILKEYKPKIQYDEDEKTRGESKTYGGYKMPHKTVMLTFDDGPHYKYTEKAIAILNEKQVPALFFELGKNIGTITSDSTFKYLSTSKQTQIISEAEALMLGSHTMNHPQLTKLDSTAMLNEIEAGFDIIKNLASDSTHLFRPPYGGFNETTINILKKYDTKPFLWNIDSRDWADPVPASIADRVVKEAVKNDRGIILLHDIHEKSIQSLELIIDTLRAKGFEFVLWDGKKVLYRNENNIAARGDNKNTLVQSASDLYRKKWALIVGINDYKEWPKLQYAVNDANGVKKVLMEKLEFKEENIILLENEQATRKNILSAFGEKLIDPSIVSKDDAVFIFYAGHGMTKKVNDKKSLGFIAPVDADNSSYSSQAISMSEINDLNEMIPARHVFWVMDACYSGLALTRGGNTGYDSKRYIKEVTNRKARQIITAGGSTEEVADGGPNGHSIFTWSLINALSGDADINGDGYITASEICNYVPPTVSSLSKQTPAYGNLIGSSGGDFIFQLKPEEGELNETTDQHDDATSELLNQIAELRAQLESVQNQLKNQESRSNSNSKDSTGLNVDTLNVDELNSLGLKAYRKKEYDLALDYFSKAIQLNDRAIQPINNLGFIHYKLGNYEEALYWIQKALKISPNRLVAYLNLADVQLALGDKESAITNYEKYLSMVKENDFAKELREKVNSLKAE